jgi:hypothetical protein
MEQVISLAGNWRYMTDENDCGIAEEYFKRTFPSNTFVLPGSTCGNHLGVKKEYYDSYCKEAVRAPMEAYEYIAPLWLQREIEVPESFEGKSIRLSLERVNISSMLWVDGTQIGREIIDLSAPHIYDLTDKLSKGAHTITLRIDNRNLVSMYEMASGYSVDTQGYWNGAIGTLQITAKDMLHIEQAEIFPKEDGIEVRLITASNRHVPLDEEEAYVTLCVLTPDGKQLDAVTQKIITWTSKQTNYVFGPIEEIVAWDEFCPKLYQLQVTLKDKDGRITDEKSFSFGMRYLSVENKQFQLNGHGLSFRGTIDCAQFPATGYPPMDVEFWKKRLLSIKEYGINHIRFHAWCPPEAAFVAADEVGMYYSIEMPLWLNRDVCGIEFGDDPIHRDFYMRQMYTILKNYGNHPSFFLFSNGNENIGDFETLEDIMRAAKSYDNRHLYTMTSNFDHPMSPYEDYFSAFLAYHNFVRIQDLHDEAAKDTGLSYEQAVSDVPAPIITFEVGQYCVYPDVDIIEDYIGNILPVNFDVIRKEMKAKGVYDRKKDYIAASGDLAVKLYKEDIEAVLRTKGMGGFELLSLTDYTGQSTATIGVLDVFARSKGVVAPEAWRQFCGPVVPLWNAKRIYTNDEQICAKLSLYNFGQKEIKAPNFKVKLYAVKNDGTKELFYEENTCGSEITIPLQHITKATQLLVTVEVEEYVNSWRIFVYPKENKEETIAFVQTKAELNQVIEQGKTAVADIRLMGDTIEGSFIPVFWSPVHFPSKKPCGAIIDSLNPIFEEFPTAKYPDYQWKELLEKSVALDLTKQDHITPIMEFVPNYVDNTKNALLFEQKVGAATIIFCGFDLNATDVVTGQLKKSIKSYLATKQET